MSQNPYFLKHVVAATLLFTAVLTFSCSSDKDNKGTTDTTTATEAKKKPAVKAAVTSIGQVNVFLEVSGSMKGFMPTNKENGVTQFQQTIDPFLATLQQNDNIQSKAFFEVREKPYTSDYNKLSQTVRYGIQQAASSTTIPAIMDSILTFHSDDNGINILISDFIYSPENGKAVSYVSTDIYQVLAKAKRQGQAVSIFGATSDFDGTFYPAKNVTKKTIEKCCQTPVPYYVWVMGKPDAVRLFNREVIKNTFAEELHLGFTYEAPAYSVLDKFMPVGNWYCATGGENCHEVAISDLSTPAEMVIGLNLANLPSAFVNDTYLKQNLKLTGENSDAKITQFYTAEKFRTLPGVTGKNTDPLKPFTHFVKVKLSKLNAPQTELRFQLANQRPGWVQQWTTLDDSQINTEGAKTFNFSGIIDGAERAYSGGSAAGNLVDIAVTLKKEK